MTTPENLKPDADPFRTIGTRILAAWAVSDAYTWIQTRCPKIAKRLRTLDGARTVARGCNGAYLLTIEIPRALNWVAREVISATGRFHPTPATTNA